MRCPDCGSENLEGSVYCEECGSKLGASDSASLIASEPPPADTSAEIIIEDYSVKLVRDVNNIGRRSPADGIYPDVDLTDYDPDSYISRRHAHILRKDDQYFFEDLGSSNGSFINEEPVKKGELRKLQNQDVIRLGRTEVFFKFS